MPEQDPEQLAEQLDREAAELERRSAELHEQVKEAGADWERKRADPAVPGAPAPEEGGEQEPSDQQTPPW